jgi:hypothetical protein
MEKDKVQDSFLIEDKIKEIVGTDPFDPRFIANKINEIIRRVNRIMFINPDV